MSTIGGRTVVDEDFASFIALYKAKPKPIFFWDTCGLLEIIRFIYRANKGVATLNSIQELARKVANDEIYCVTSVLACKEWDDNVDSAIKVTKDGLPLTEQYHSLALATINAFFSQSLAPVSISTFRLEEMLRDIAFNIALASHFIKYDEIATNTMARVAAKRRPAKDKQAEIKDCAMWETMLRLCSDIHAAIPAGSPKKVFYTVNTADFADKGRVPMDFFGELKNEAAAHGFNCALMIDDAVNAL